MLQQTLIHIPGVGRRTEQELSASGICSWDDADRFEKRSAMFRPASAETRRIHPSFREAIKHKDAGFSNA